VILLVLEAESPAVAEVRCPRCHRLLFRGTLVGEIQCSKCAALVKFWPPVS